MNKCIDCGRRTGRKGDYIYCDVCIEFRYKKATQIQNDSCKNLEKNKCVSKLKFFDKYNDKYTWLPDNKCTYTVHKTGYIILSNICWNCEEYNKLLSKYDNICSTLNDTNKKKIIFYKKLV